MPEVFHRFAKRASDAAGLPWALIASLAIVVTWLLLSDLDGVASPFIDLEALSDRDIDRIAHRLIGLSAPGQGDASSQTTSAFAQGTSPDARR